MTPMEPEELLLFAADAARMMLESGGETYRAEETAMGIITSQGGAEAECFALSTGLMLSFSGPDGRIQSITRRIKKHGMNLEKVYRIESMVRNLQRSSITMDEAARELDEVERMQELPIAARMAASAFALLFGGTVIEAAVAAFVGTLLSLLVAGFQKLRLPGFVTTLAGGAIATFATLAIKAAGLAIDTDATIIGVIMLLVPGVAITNAIRDSIAGDLVAGLARGADAFLTAAAISAGAGFAYTIWRLIPGGGL